MPHLVFIHKLLLFSIKFFCTTTKVVNIKVIFNSYSDFLSVTKFSSALQHFGKQQQQ